MQRVSNQNLTIVSPSDSFPNKCEIQLNDFKAPAESAIAYMTKPVDGLATDSIFGGDPTPELDHAWHVLMASTNRARLSFGTEYHLQAHELDINLRLSPEEMRRLNQTSLAFSDGSGYLGTLGVYHELHCVVIISTSRLKIPTS